MGLPFTSDLHLQQVPKQMTDSSQGGTAGLPGSVFVVGQVFWQGLCGERKPLRCLKTKPIHLIDEALRYIHE
jgi:hypothetical protein